MTFYFKFKLIPKILTKLVLVKLWIIIKKADKKFSNTSGHPFQLTFDTFIVF